MTEIIRDTPSVARPYCPVCEPDTDPNAALLDVRYCTAHTPVNAGIDDDAVALASYPSGSGEAGGEDNRRWCNLFHRKNTMIRFASAKIDNHPIKSSS